MKGEPNERAIQLGEYIIETKSTVRGAAAQFGISKSTVHKDLQERLPKICPSLYPQVREVLDTNKQERHIRGGLATKHKYEIKKSSRSGAPDDAIRISVD